ncbi:hypothetical protein ABPG74_005999 [Tetrahymena malaccensis]
MSGYDLKQKLNAALTTLEESKNSYYKLQQSGDFQYITKRIAVTEPLGHDNTQCLYKGCSSKVCHEDCSVGENKQQCCCMEERDGSYYCKECGHEYTQHHNQTHRQVIREIQEQVRFDRTEQLKQLQQDIQNNLKAVEQLQAQLPNPINFLNFNKQNKKDLKPSVFRALCAKEKQKTACNLTQKQITVAAELLDRKKMEQLGFLENLEFTTLDEVYIKKKSPKLIAYLRGEIPQEIKNQKEDEFFKQLLCNYAQQDAVESVDKLIKVHKYDPNYIPQNLGKGPIHLAAEAGNADVIDCLIKNQADIYLVDNNNKKPYQLAQNPKVRERLINEHKCLTKQKLVNQKFANLKMSIDQIAQQEVQDILQDDDLINIIKNGQLNKKKLNHAILEKAEEVFENINYEVNQQQKNIFKKFNEMIQDIYQFGENPKELKQILQKIKKQIKFDQGAAIKDIKQNKIQTVEDYQKYVQQSQEKLKAKFSEKLKKQQSLLDQFIQKYNQLRNNTNMLIKYPAIILESIQSSNLYDEITKNNFDNYKLKQAETFEELLDIMNDKHTYNSTLLINMDFNQQQIKELEQFDRLNKKKQQILRKIFLVGRNLQQNQLSKEFQNKIMSISTNSRVVDHLFYDDKELSFLGMISPDLLFTFVNNPVNQDIITRSTPISKREINLFGTYEEFLQYNKKICEDINISMFLRKNNSIINRYKGQVSWWLQEIDKEYQTYKNWHIDNQENIGLLYSYIRGPFCYLLNSGINLGDEIIFQQLKRHILLLNYYIQQNQNDKIDFFNQSDIRKFYRGVGMTSIEECQQVYDQYNETQIFYFPAFTSSTTDFNFCKEWQKNNNQYILFNIQVKKQYNIPQHQRPLDMVKLCPTQAEFLFPFFSKFQCISKEISKIDNKKVYIINIEQIPK